MSQNQNQGKFFKSFISIAKIANLFVKFIKFILKYQFLPTYC